MTEEETRERKRLRSKEYYHRNKHLINALKTPKTKTRCDCAGGAGGDGWATEKYKGYWVCKECKRKDEALARWSNEYVDWNCNKYYE